MLCNRCGCQRSRSLGLRTPTTPRKPCTSSRYPLARFSTSVPSSSSRTSSTSHLRPRAGPLQVAIIGSGPSGFYTASRILSLLPVDTPSGRDVRVHMYERLPTPYGLVRYGVAPDHPEVKVSPSSQLTSQDVCSLMLMRGGAELSTQVRRTVFRSTLHISRQHLHRYPAFILIYIHIPSHHPLFLYLPACPTCTAT